MYLREEHLSWWTLLNNIALMWTNLELLLSSGGLIEQPPLVCFPIWALAGTFYHCICFPRSPHVKFIGSALACSPTRSQAMWCCINYAEYFSFLTSGVSGRCGTACCNCNSIGVSVCRLCRLRHLNMCHWKYTMRSLAWMPIMIQCSFLQLAIITLPLVLICIEPT